MALRTKVQPLDREVQIILNEDLSPKAQSAALAQFAAEQIDDAKKVNGTILGRQPRYTVTVDGRTGAPLESVRPDGAIFAEFDLFVDTLTWIANQLTIHSPFKTGNFRANNTLFADGVEVDPFGVIPADVSEFVFINTTPYARKIERGLSSQAPDGVFQVVASLAQRKFGNVAKVSFGFRTAIEQRIVAGRAGDRSRERNPAIIVRLWG